MAQIQAHDPRLLDFLLSDTMLDLVQPLVGPDIAVWSSHMISKPARTGKATPWHTDAAYWEGRVSTMAGICTVWLALDEVTAENGCMQVIPGTHLSEEAADLGNYEPVDTGGNIFANQVRPGLINTAVAVELLLRPNQCSIHDARIVHGASPNTSGKRRAGYAMRYLPTTTKVISGHHLNHNHKLWLARGRDWAGNRYEN
jgi:chlorinating enzyme